MKNIFKGLGLTLFVLVFVLGVGASSANAALTFSNLAVDSAAGDAMTIGASNVAGTIAIGVANTGGITIGNGATAKTISIGSGAAINTINLGTGAAANVITIGSVTDAASMSLLVGTGNFALNGAATSTYTVGAATTSGTITIGGTAQTGAIAIGDTAASVVTEISIGGGDGVKTAINIGDGTGANGINIGGAASTTTITGTAVVTGTLNVSSYTLKSVANTLTAVGTTQADALALTKDYNNVTVGATTTGVKLPVAQTGMDITVRNSVANTIHIYAAASETLNGTAGATGLNLDASTGTRCVAMSTSVWLCNTIGAIEV